MKTGDILVIDKVEVLLDGGDEIGRTITDKAGNAHKIKKGQGGKLIEKWHLLEAGKAIKLTIGQFKGFDFIADFELVQDVFLQQATEKVQLQIKDSREGSIEAQVSLKATVELLVGKVIDLDHPLSKAALLWALGKLGMETKELGFIGADVKIIPKPKATLDAPQLKSEPLKEQDHSKPQGTPQEAVMADLKILIDHKPKIWGTVKMMEELNKLGATGVKVIEAVQSLPPDKLREFHEIVKKVLPKEIK